MPCIDLTENELSPGQSINRIRQPKSQQKPFLFHISSGQIFDNWNEDSWLGAFLFLAGSTHKAACMAVKELKSK